MDSSSKGKSRRSGTEDVLEDSRPSLPSRLGTSARNVTRSTRSGMLRQTSRMHVTRTHAKSLKQEENDALAQEPTNVDQNPVDSSLELSKISSGTLGNVAASLTSPKPDSKSTRNFRRSIETNQSTPTSPGAFRMSHLDNDTAGIEDVEDETTYNNHNDPEDSERTEDDTLANSLIRRTVEAAISRRFGFDSYAVPDEPMASARPINDSNPEIVAPRSESVDEIQLSHKSSGEVIIASPLETENSMSRGRKMCGLPVWVVAVIILVAAAAIVGIVLSTVLGGDKPSASRNRSPEAAQLLRDEILRQLEPHLFESTLDNFQNPESPQSQALTWLSELDDSPTGDNVVERFSLATLFLAFEATFYEVYLQSGVSFCEWREKGVYDGSIGYNGVECDENGRVKGLQLLYSDADIGQDAFQHFAELPAEIAFLTNMESLEMEILAVTGKLPSEVALMTKLVALDLLDSAITGTLPSEYGLLDQLESFFIGEGEAEGSIPTEYGAMTKMENFDVSLNALTRNVPESIAAWTNIEYLVLGENYFSGTLPPYFFSQMTNMLELELKVNDFEGTLPTELGRMTYSDAVWLQNNQFSGELPSEIGLMMQLRVLDVSINELTGSLPAELAYLTNLVDLFVFHNELVGDLDPVVCALHEFELDSSVADCSLIGGGKVNCTCCTECYDTDNTDDRTR